MTAQINDGKIITEKEISVNPVLNSKIEPDSPMKEWLINYVGQKHDPNDDEVTVEMIIETVAKEFPDFLLAVAEENWIRGYRQAFVDIELGGKLYKGQQAASNLEAENA